MDVVDADPVRVRCDPGDRTQGPPREPPAPRRGGHERRQSADEGELPDPPDRVLDTSKRFSYYEHARSPRSGNPAAHHPEALIAWRDPSGKPDPRPL